MADPKYGEVWMADFDPTRGHEQSGRRPALIISEDMFNTSGAELVIALPLTTKKKNIIYHVEAAPPEGGLTQRSYIKCEDIRSISIERLSRRMGSVSAEVMAEVEYRLRMLLRL